MYVLKYGARNCCPAYCPKSDSMRCLHWKTNTDNVHPVTTSQKRFGVQEILAHGAVEWWKRPARN